MTVRKLLRHPLVALGRRVACGAALAVLTAGVTGAPAYAANLSAPVVSSRLAGLHLVDYFPAAEAWDNMWTRFDPTAIAADFARLAAMHANAVKIIPRVPAFGYPQPSQVMLSRLAQTVTLAQQHGLRVVLTMFDGFSNYSDITGSKQWLSALLGPYAGSGEIAYVDLRNEVNLEPSAALPWAQQMLPYAQTVLKGIPVTVSVTINEGSGNLQKVLTGLGAIRPDLYDAHFYGQDGQAYVRLRDIQRVVAPVPVVLGETGYATTPSNSAVGGLAQTQASQEAYQDYYYRSVDYAASLLGIPAAPWILSDFTSTAWPGASTQLFGLYRADGTAKPAAQTESDYFSGSAISASFNNGFEQVISVNGQAEPTLWREYQPAGVTAAFAADSSVAHSGADSARISGTNGGAYGCASLYLVPISALNPTQIYTAQVYARGQAATGSTYVSLSWFDASGVYLSQTTSRNVPLGTSVWGLLTASGAPPPGAAFVQLHLKSCRNSGSVWFDDVQFGPVLASGGVAVAASNIPVPVPRARAARAAVESKNQGIAPTAMAPASRRTKARLSRHPRGHRGRIRTLGGNARGGRNAPGLSRLLDQARLIAAMLRQFGALAQ